MSGVEGVIRFATESDLPAVLRVDELAPVARPRIGFLTLRVQSGECHVFECQGDVVGYVTLRRRTFIGRDFVDLVAVVPSVRRQGVASALLRHAVAIASTPQIFISTNQSNAAMIQLFEKEGWTFSGQLEGIDEGDPELIYYIRST
jgi:ribosomal protein S18 acetylase RimI-like enzyme